MSKETQPHWYKIKGIWYHCITTENGDRYVNGEKQNVDDYSFTRVSVEERQRERSDKYDYLIGDDDDIKINQNKDEN